MGDLVRPEGVDGEGLLGAEGGEVGVGPVGEGVAREGGVVALFCMCERFRLLWGNLGRECREKMIEGIG